VAVLPVGQALLPVCDRRRQAGVHSGPSGRVLCWTDACIAELGPICASQP
jgi:hypothetical protein